MRQLLQTFRDMNRILLVLLILSGLSVQAQIQVDYPFNPDGNADGLVSVSDLMELLTVYGEEFTAGNLSSDSTSAIFYVGDMDYYDCKSSCYSLEGNWKVLDDFLVGSYKDELSQHAVVFMDRGQPVPGADAHLTLTIETNGWWSGTAYANNTNSCVCQTRVVPQVEMGGGTCDYVDLCGICEGPGPIHECGCDEIESWACDCEGNQLDALGVCGGGCLGDYDGDGECDEYVPGACNSLTDWDYDGYTYDLVEIGGRCWFKQDLRTEHYSNGDSIPYAEADSVWVAAGDSYTGAWSVLPGYEYNGYVYNWYTTIDERGVCPSGWHVPLRTEYIELFDSLLAGVTSQNFGYLNDILFDDGVAPGNNQTGFSATFTTYRGSSGGYTSTNDKFLSWTQSYSAGLASWHMTLDDDNIPNTTNYGFQQILSLTLSETHRASGYSVRCIKDQ
jgi:uncharacterized protein (TIGR02145 family)